ncbi:hypothetical protein C8R43DRAFT_1030738 [Mycena crocata]|nr:hypothetical protein C8R43DRAFT_1030738 [Mycena crocata]
MPSRSSLDTLPNELLYEILEHLTKEVDQAIPSRYRIFTTIGSINQRLRQFAVPHIFKQVRVPNCGRSPAMFNLFSQHLSLIKSIRVGHPSLFMFHASDPCMMDGWKEYLLFLTPDFRVPAALEFPRLHNLVSFDCLGFCFDPWQLQEMCGKSNSILRSLRLGWHAGHNFPFEGFPALRNLFVYVIYRGQTYKRTVLQKQVFPPLATLSISDSKRWFKKRIYSLITFPNLRALHLHSSACADHILDFISCHPTLLEVNISKICITLPDFVQLAKNVSPSDQVSGLGPADPAFAVWNDLELYHFFFVRATPRQPENPSNPKLPHTLTELGLETSPDDPLLLQNIGGLGEFPLFADCTRLSLVIPDWGDEEDPDMWSVASIVNVLKEGLAKWTNLRYLHFGCNFPDYWGDALDARSEKWKYDDRPPMCGGKALCFKDLCDEDPDDDFTSDFRQAVIDWGFDCHDDTCGMELWKAPHEGSMARLVWQLAAVCNTLEMFEWSMQDCEFDTAELRAGLCSHPPLWRWSIHRNANASVRLVSGHLTWNGHPNHPTAYIDTHFKTYKDW